MSYKTNWFSKRDLKRLCDSVTNLFGIELTADTLCDVVSGQIAGGGYGANVEEKLIRQGVSLTDVEMLLSDLANSEIDDDDQARHLTTRQAAEVLGISETRIRQLCQEGRMGKRVGRDWVITPEEIEANRVRKPGRPAKSK
jgi:excisionase family DNA binding protein